MDINKYLDTPENQNQNQKNNLDFQNPENLFSQLKNSTNISKPVFENVFSNFEKQTWEQWKQILEDMSKFIEKNDLKDVENIACVCLFIENISKKHWANTEMVINFLKNKNPVLLLKMINSFKDNIKDIENKQHSKQKDQTVSQKDQTVSQKKYNLFYFS